MEELSVEEFSKIKEKVLGSCDLSRKGSIDEAVVELVSLINASPHFFTTSSCSGRIVLFAKDSDDAKVGCKWLLVSHDLIDENELLAQIKAECHQSNLYLKFEPFIMHVSCMTLQHTNIMQMCALGAGYRNSGMILGKRGKITFAVRSTQNLEVPISNCGQLLVSDQYIQYLAKLANDKMDANRKRIRKFQSLCQSFLKND